MFEGHYLAEGHGYIVLFTDEDEGTVVKSTNTDVKVGTHGSFDEKEFTPLPPDAVVTMG